MSDWPKLVLKYGLIDGNLIAPNVLVRSAVFSARDFNGHATREAIAEPEHLPSNEPYVVVQMEGERLSQSDAEVFFWLLSRAYKVNPPRSPVQVCFQIGDAVKELGRARGGKTVKLFEDSLMRLAEAAFSFGRDGGPAVNTKLLVSVERLTSEAGTSDYNVTLADGVAKLLVGRDWVYLRGHERRALVGDSLAKALYAFYASHETPYAMRWSTVQGIMGRNGVGVQDSKWRLALVNALERVKLATGWFRCELATEGEYAGLVVVQKSESSKPPPVPKRKKESADNELNTKPSRTKRRWKTISN